MAYTVVIDAGHGGTDPGATFEGRQEKDDNLNLALAVGQILSDNGIDVKYTRTTDVYDTPFQKATFANEAGADFFVSLHRNSGPVANAYEGVETLVYDDSGIKADMARNINRNLEEIGFKNLGVTERPNLVVLKRTKMPAVLVEAGFINSYADNERFDELFNETAQAIADGILETLGMSQENIKENVLYRVQVAAYSNQTSADAMAQQLQQEGYPAFVVYNNGLYKVQVGAFEELENATLMEKALRDAGYSTFIVS
ncbi:MAG: N-acetylmuramoyl-L-alanine amidase [Eubacterium sp.]